MQDSGLSSFLFASQFADRQGLESIQFEKKRLKSYTITCLHMLNLVFERYAMNLNLDMQKLNELMQAFYTLTAIKIAIFDSEYNEILSCPEKHCAFCKLMHDNRETSLCCIESNYQSFEHCKKSGELMVYHCHAGLIEAAAPLKDNGVIIGYIMFGQITDIADQAELVRKLQLICSEHRIGEKFEDSQAASVTYKSREQIMAAAKILEACTFYVLLKKMIFLEKQQFVNRLNLFIEKHIAEDISVKNLCSEFQISRSKLYEVSNQYLGIGIAEYIKEKRIRKAKDCLRNTELSVADIAERVGFADYNYFCRSFKKEVGVPAKRFRMNYRQDANEN